MTPISPALCRSFDRFEGRSPFQKNIVLGYYDGATEALAGMSDQAFLIKMIAWDANQDIRCYSVMELTQISFYELEQLFAPFGLPQYPDWIPKLYFPDKKSEQVFNLRVASVIEKALAIRWVILGESISGMIKMRMANDSLRLISKHADNSGDHRAIKECLEFFQ